MDLRNNKGITGIDISVALIIIVLFVGIVSTLSYNYVVASRSVNRKAIATNIAIARIEELKQTPYDEILEMDETSQDATKYANADGVMLTSGSGPYKVVTKVQKYTNPNIENIQDVIKIITVTVNYNIANREENIELRSTITKED